MIMENMHVVGTAPLDNMPLIQEKYVPNKPPTRNEVMVFPESLTKKVPSPKKFSKCDVYQMRFMSYDEFMDKVVYRIRKNKQVAVIVISPGMINDFEHDPVRFWNKHIKERIDW